MAHFLLLNDGGNMNDQDSTSNYLAEIRKYPLLSFEEELELSRRIQEGDINAHKKLIESNLRLVVKLSRKYATPELPLLDIIQEGNLGLITAAQKYEFSFNVRFSTYACWWIQQSIIRALANKRRLIRLPFRKEELAVRCRRASSELFQLLSRKPTIEELANELHISPQEVSDIIRTSGSVTSLDIQIDDDETSCLKDLIPDTTYNPEEMFMKKYTHSCMLQILSGLKKKERDVMLKRYNFQKDGKNYTLKAIGNQYGVSSETIRQVELRALKKLRNCSDEFREIAYS